MARGSEGRAGGVADYCSPPPRGPRGRATRGPPTARADTLVKPKGSGTPSPPTVRLTLLQTLKLPAGLWLNFQPPQAFLRGFGVTQPT